MKLTSLTLLKTVISLGILAIVFMHVNWSQIWAQLQTLSIPFVLFALLYYTGCQWLSCLRWQVILQATNHHVPIQSLLSSYFAGMFLNNFLPGAFGGDVYRVYRVTQHSQDAEVALVSVFLERFSGLAALSTLAVLGLPPAFRLIARWDIIVLFLVCVATLVGGVLLIASPQLLRWAEPWLMRLRLGRIIDRLVKIQRLLRQFAQHRLALAKSLGLSLILMLAIVFYHYLIAQQLHIPVSYLELLVFIPIVAVVTLLPISLGGLGVKEGLWIYLFNRIGIPMEKALLLSITITALSWLLSLPGGAILLFDSIAVPSTKSSR